MKKLLFIFTFICAFAVQAEPLMLVAPVSGNENQTTGNNDTAQKKVIDGSSIGDIMTKPIVTVHVKDVSMSLSTASFFIDVANVDVSNFNYLDAAHVPQNKQIVMRIRGVVPMEMLTPRCEASEEIIGLLNERLKGKIRQAIDAGQEVKFTNVVRLSLNSETWIGDMFVNGVNILTPPFSFYKEFIAEKYQTDDRLQNPMCIQEPSRANFDSPIWGEMSTIFPDEIAGIYQRYYIPEEMRVTAKDSLTFVVKEFTINTDSDCSTLAVDKLSTEAEESMNGSIYVDKMILNCASGTPPISCETCNSVPDPVTDRSNDSAIPPPSDGELNQSQYPDQIQDSNNSVPMSDLTPATDINQDE